MVDANEGSELQTRITGYDYSKYNLEARYIHKYPPFTHI